MGKQFSADNFQKLFYLVGKLGQDNSVELEHEFDSLDDALAEALAINENPEQRGYVAELENVRVFDRHGCSYE